MKIVTPDYYPQFHCIASACPDTCCAGWEVVVDPEAEKRYRSLEGALGGRLRASMGEDEGESIFTPGEDGRCPFLNQQNLCDIQAALGEDGLCRTCHLYPRFLNDFGGTREMGLSLSCPEAARIILTAPSLPGYRTEDHPELPPDLNDLDAGRYFAVKGARDRILSILSGGEVDEAVALSLRLARKAGKCIQKGHPEKAEGLAASFDRESALEKEKGRAEGASPLSAETVIGELLGLLILRDSWRARLEKAALPEAKIPPLDPEYERKVLVQLAFRYLLKAAYDGRLHARMKFIAFSLLALRILGRGMDHESLLTLTVNYSREVEHCEENMEALLRRFDKGGKYGGRAFAAQLLQK